MKDYSAPGAIARLPGEKYADFAARQRADLAARSQPPKKRARRKTPTARRTAEQRAADRIDGYDRDDI